MTISRVALALTAGTLLVAPLQAQDTWSWHKAVPAGHMIEIKGVNGNIVATAASGNEVEVVARKTAKHSDPADVKLQVVEHADGVTICAVYPTPRFSHEENECRPGEKGHMSTRNNDVQVDFEVRVPRGVQFVARTVNGRVRGDGLTAYAVGTTVNGSVHLATTGLATAKTVNGGIDVRMGEANWKNEVEFTTVNGNIAIEGPASLNADVEASTVNGSMSSDWPITVQGRWGPKRMQGKIGNGGSELTLSTVNGDIELRRAH